MAPKTCAPGKRPTLVSEYMRCQAKPKSKKRSKIVLPAMPRGTPTLMGYRLRDVKKGVYKRRPAKIM